MRSPQDMEVIQIEITNGCVRTCSNCTRFCGHHKKPYFMDFDTFKRAVDSVEGYTGVVGIMGGEPTIHPKFPEFTQYLNSKFKTRDNLNAARKPLKDFLTYTRAKHNVNRVLNKCAGPGLWTSITSKYEEHYELIQDTFTFQNINDHSKISYHHPLLVSREDLKIPDDEWIKLRDKCWIQNCWSASITPKGAFFCEVAASLDMLFNGPGGWPIKPGWWKITPEQFGSQLKWCELCGGALTTFRRNANEGITDATPTLYEKLKQIKSPMLEKNKILVFSDKDFDKTKAHMEFKANQYIDDFSNRLSDSVKYLKDLPIEKLNVNKQCFGLSLYNCLYNSANKLTVDWFLYCENESADTENLIEIAKSRYLNNGVLYKLSDDIYLFSKKAEALRKFGDDRIINSRSFSEIISAYPLDKIIDVDFHEDELVKDELSWRKHIDNDFLNVDITFKTIFNSMVLSKVKKGDNIVITQTASYFLTRGLIALLNDMGMNVFLITHKRFADKFEDVVSRMLVFDDKDYFDFDELKPLLDNIDIKFEGAIVPYSVPRSVIVDEDGYQNIEKCAAYLTNVIARVNIKRDFVKIDFDINGQVFNNPWCY